MRMYTKCASSAGIILTVLAVAGCSKNAPVSPSVVTSTQSPPSSTVSKQVVAPQVKNPLDASKFIADPCLSLTQSQQQQFEGTKSGMRSDSDNGVGCFWNFGANGSAITSVSFIPKVTDGLTHTYQQNAANFFDHGYFVPVDVDGYPAAYNELIDRRSGGQCGLTVGVSDQSIFAVLIQGRPNTDGCKAAMNVAKAVLQTIRGGQ